MSIPLIVAATLVLVILVGLSVLIRRRYQDSLTSVAEKSAGLPFYYRSLVSSVFGADAGLAQWTALAHYVALHMVVPLLGLGFFLRTDGNFLVVIVSLLWSLQLVQRLFPGPRPGLDESEEYADTNSND
jgi:hypothetical protein